MAEICNNPKQRGFVLATSLFIMLLLLSLGLYVASFTLTELRISQSQASSVQTYYLAEAGIAEAIWKIKNDNTWKDGFEGSETWSVDYTRNSALYPNGSYRIQINNNAVAKGDIIVTAYLNLSSGGTAQRVVKTNVYKALGISAIGQNGEYADGNIDMSGTVLNVFNGGFFSNNNIIVNYWSVISATGDVGAVGNVVLNQSSHIVASSTSAHNYPPAPDPIPMPSISFDNAGDPNSYKALADNIYTERQFEDLLWDNRGGTLTLDGVTYVTGDIDIKGGVDLTVNGILVADGNITLGENTHFCCWGISCGRSDVTINRVGSTTPAGLLSKGNVTFELCLDEFNGQGLVYANDKINILSLPRRIDVTGGLVARKLTLTSLWQGVNITYDNSIVNYTLGDPEFSPIVTVEHWEEEY
ncbi:MAG: hypothetical protein BWZ03_00363 [bacterium ADurb.BinA186]|nr:MAG: hypothetical protein BWZ03_00363 [bacterium ADurb.BinA186]